MFALIGSGGFIVSVLGIAFFSWLIRSFAESDYEPFLVHLTFFAFAGQLIRTGELIREHNPDMPLVLSLLLFAAIMVLLQNAVLRFQSARTLEHYKAVLFKYSNKANSTDVEHWAPVLVRITGVDFYPEFYMKLNTGLGSGPREKLRREGVSIVPGDLFNCGETSINSEALMVPPEGRRFLWRCYVLVCISSWVVFIGCLLVPRNI